MTAVDVEHHSAMMFLRTEKGELSFPVFPSDAIALAMLQRAPMFIDEELLIGIAESPTAQSMLLSIEAVVPIALTE